MSTSLKEAYKMRVQNLKRLLTEYHTNDQAREIIDQALRIYNSLHPDSLPCETLRKVFIERSGVSIRQISKECYINHRTVYKHINKMLSSLMPIVYGVDGILFE
jgi:type II secretory pathway component PulL